MTMIRRDALMRMATLSGAAASAWFFPGCAAKLTSALAPWNGPPPEEHDIRLRALGLAILAPNAHNTQPWRVRLIEGGLDLAVDRERLLPATDPPFRQTHISQGTFLEHLVLGLRAFGADAAVTYFPEGEYGPLALEDRPVARVMVRPRAVSAERSPLFDAIPHRLSHKGLYDPTRAVSEAHLTAIAGARDPAEETLETRILREPLVLASLTGICRDAMATEIKARDRNVETARWFRFSDAEMEAKGDGFGLAQAGQTGFSKWFIETFVIDRASAADPSGMFASSAVTLARDQAASAPTFGVIVSHENTRRAQVQAGRAYARTALTATSLGVDTHPMSQALEEYDDMREVKARLDSLVGCRSGDAVQMLFRIGYGQTRMRHAPRRDVRAILRAR